MQRNVIDYIFAAEFNAKQGNVIAGVYPSDFDLSLETLFIEKLIPDGIHNFSDDAFSFKNLVPVDSDRLLRFIDNFNSQKVTLRASFPSPSGLLSAPHVLAIDAEFQLVLTPTAAYPNPASFIDLSVEPMVASKFDLRSPFTFQAIQDTVVYLSIPQTSDSLPPLPHVTDVYLEAASSDYDFNNLQFLLGLFSQSSAKKVMTAITRSEKTHERVYCVMRFHTRVETKKEKVFERGAIFKSITIGTYLYADLSSFDNYSRLILADYLKATPFEPSPSQKFSPEALDILRHYFTHQNGILSQPDFRFSDQTLLLSHFPDLPYEESFLRDLVLTFKELFMVFYREILLEGRVVVYSQKLPISRLNQVVEALRYTTFPLNFDARIYPFETLTGIRLLQLEKSYVAAFNNPIIKMETGIWTLLIDLDDQVALRPNGKPVSPDEIALVDRMLGDNFYGLKNVTSTKIAKSMWNFNRMQINLARPGTFQPAQIQASDLKEDLIKNLDKIKGTSYFPQLNNDGLFFQYFSEAQFGPAGKGVLEACEFFGRDFYQQNWVSDDMTVFFHLFRLTRAIDSPVKEKSFLRLLDIKAGLKRFLSLIFSGNPFVTDVFLEFFERIKGYPEVAEAVEGAGFVYRMALNRKKAAAQKNKE